MAKLMVEIDIPQCSYDELRKEVLEEPDKHDWFDPEDGDKIVVDEAFLRRAMCDNSFYAFTLIGVRP